MTKRSYNYFDRFIHLADYSCDSALLLHSTLNNFNYNHLSDHILELHNIEHSADVAAHHLINQLVKEYIIPFDRDDIINLTKNLDDVTDAIEDVLIGIDIFNIKVIRPEILDFTALIITCTQALKDALEEFYNFKKSTTLQSKIIEINRLEEEGDLLFTNGVRSLHRTSTDPVELLVWTDILNRLELCCDACDCVANNIENVMMKN